MIKQKTSNTFLGGIIQDANPLNAELTSLRDCLNGTLISNDGDEMILQNDMGNARVFQIRLDSGYVPVGMCVHGGVTYIASYNPITNKSQVGSFPSPLESYFSQSWGEDGDMATLCGTLGNGRLEFVLQLFPTDTIIRPGDRFDIFVSDQKYFDRTLISNTDNIKNGIVASPKKKAVTLSICIADSSGNLHDITPTLKRFEINSNKEIVFDDDSLIKQNTGTIFQKYPDENKGENGSIVDQYDVDPKNIYNHKISGNLFLVYRLNTIDSIDISAEFLKGPVVGKSLYLDLKNDTSGVTGDIEEGKLDVVFDVIYRYNSPDGYYNPEEDKTGTYADLHGSESNYNPSKVINGVLGEQLIDGTSKTTVALEFEADNSAISKPVYDFDTDLYSSRLRYLLEGIDIKDKKYIKYSLVPSTIYGNLNFFKQDIEVDLEKLNSGEVSIYQWRYFVEDSGININWGLQSYPFVGTRLTNVKLEFFNLSNPSDPVYEYKIGERTSYHGNFLNYISFDNLKPRQVYCVGISYLLTNIINGLEPTGKFYAGFRILISTKLYNTVYANQSILDFNDLEDSLYEKLHLYSPKSVHLVRDISDQSVLSVEGSPLIIGDSTQTQSQVVKTKAVNTKKEVVSTLDTLDKDLYPFDVRDIDYKYGSLLSIGDGAEIDGTLVIQGSDRDNAESIESSVEASVDLLKSSVSSDGIIEITGDLKSLFIGDVLEDRPVTFPKALMLYFPKFSGEDEEGYVKEQHERLFGYAGFKGLTYPYYIAYGITYRGLSGHKDHHGVKYIEVDRSNGETVQDLSTMRDLHPQVYGDSWDYPDVYAVGDGHKQFNMAKFLSNQNFINLLKDRTFVFFHTENIEYNIDNVADWIGCYREGDGWNDKKIVKNGTINMLFWKAGDQFYLITSGLNASRQYYTPLTFCSIMSNIYIKTQEEVTIPEANILSSINNAYNLDYAVRFRYKSDITPSYAAYIPDLITKYDAPLDGVGANFDSLFQDLKAENGIDLDPETLAELKKYTEFIFDKSGQSLELSFTISMEGMEDIQDAAVMLNDGIYDIPVLIDENNKMYLEDEQKNSLLLSLAYELATVDGKLCPCKFGTRDSNNIEIKPNIKIENGEIIPGRPKSLSTVLVNGGDGDQQTTLNLNSQRIIQLK